MTSATRLILVEGVMGSGKSTLTRFLAGQLNRSGRPARAHLEQWRNPRAAARRAEAGPPADLVARPATTLGRREKVWRHVNPAEVRRDILREWERWAEDTAAAQEISVLDGFLFSRDVAALHMMGEEPSELAGHVEAVLGIVSALRPVLIYMYQADVEGSLIRTAAHRGAHWVALQERAKLSSPRATRDDLRGLEGLAQLLRSFRETTDRLFEACPAPKLALETGIGSWASREAAALRFLGVSRRLDPAFLCWRAQKEVRTRIARHLVRISG